MPEGRRGEPKREELALQEITHSLGLLRDALAQGDLSSVDKFANTIERGRKELVDQLPEISDETSKNDAGFYSPVHAVLVMFSVIRDELRSVGPEKVSRLRIMVDQANQLLTHPVRIRSARVKHGVMGGESVEDFAIPNLVEIRREEAEPETYTKFEQCFRDFMARRKALQIVTQADVKLLEEAAMACADLFSQLPEEKRGSRQAPTAHWLVSAHVFLLREHCRMAMGMRLPMEGDLHVLAATIEGLFHTTSKNQIDSQLHPGAVHAPRFVPPPQGPLYRTIRR